MIVTLGRYSMARYFPGKSISKIHGTAQKNGDIVYFAMYHPAAALHQPKYKPQLLADFARLPKLLEQARAERSREAPANEDESPDEDPKQLTLF